MDNPPSNKSSITESSHPFSAPTMPSSRRSPRRRSRDSRTKPSSLGMREEGKLEQRKKNHYDEQWDARFKELLSYRSEHGDCNAPWKQGKLGPWVHRQRVAYKAGSLSQGRIDRLSSIGFKWALFEERAAKKWNTRFNELIEYKAEHGDCNVPQRQGQLGKWVSHQRVTYLADSLAQDRIDRLSSIGFDWRLKEGCWDTQLQELVRYQAKHGDCNVPQRQGQLGLWILTQRRVYRKGKLSQDRIDRLNGIGFDWTLRRGGSRKRKAPPSTRRQSFSRKERVSLPSYVNSPFVGAEPNGFKGEGRRATSVPSLKVPPKRSDHSRWTESDDEVDEIGAMIYDQAMRQR